MRLSGNDIAKSGATAFVAEVKCPWCDRVASISLGPQHRHGRADMHCPKCGRFSTHQVKLADAWFDQHDEKMKEEREVWKKIPADAYVSCRRGMQGAPFVYTLYLGKGDPKEYFSRDSVEHALTSEFGMSWEQANSILMSAALTPGLRVWFRNLTKISSALEERQTKTSKTIRCGATVKINGREALFLRYADEGFAVVAYPGIGDTQVPVVDLEVVDTGDTPAEVGFPQDEDFLMEQVGEPVNDIGDAIEELEEIQEKAEQIKQVILDDRIDEEEEHAHAEHEEHEHDEVEHEANRRTAAPLPTADLNSRRQTLQKIINDPNTDPATLQEAQRQFSQMKMPAQAPSPARPQPGMRPLAKKQAAWWDKSEKELEVQDRPDQKSKAPREKSRAEESDLYPKEGDEYPEYAKDDKNLDKKVANRDAQRRVHIAYNATGDLKMAINAHRADLSVLDIRDVLRFYTGTGKIASHEADDLARWFIGSKPRLLSARQIRGYVSGSPGSYHVRSEEGKNLGGPYKTRDQAKKRLKQVEYFKHKGAVDPKEVNTPPKGSMLDRNFGVKVCPACGRKNPKSWPSCPCGGRKAASAGLSAKAMRKQALLDQGMGIFQPAMYNGTEVMVIAIDNTGNHATVENGEKNQFTVDVSKLTPVKKGPFTGKPR